MKLHKIFVTLATGLCLLATGTLAPQTLFAREMTFTTLATPNSLRGDAESIFFEELEKATGGEIKTNIFWGESFVKSQETLKAVGRGAVDMGFIQINHYPKQLFLHSAIGTIQQSPVKYENCVAFYDKIYDNIPELNEELAKYNVKVIFYYGTMFYGAASTKPITSFRDLKGKKIRMASRWCLSLLKELGAIPSSVPSSDITMSLQTGAIDANFSNIDGVAGGHFEDVAKHIFICKEFRPPIPYLLVINKKTWDKMSPELQNQFHQARDNASRRFAKVYENYFEQILKQYSRPDLTLTIAAPEEIQVWMGLKAIKQNQDIWIKEANEAGIKNAAEIMARLNTYNDEAIALEK